MSSTTRRQPITFNIPAQPDYKLQNIVNFGGVEITDNPLNVATNKASDCLNVYVDETNTLTTRPRIEPFANTSKNIIAYAKVDDNTLVGVENTQTTSSISSYIIEKGGNTLSSSDVFTFDLGRAFSNYSSAVISFDVTHIDSSMVGTPTVTEALKYGNVTLTTVPSTKSASGVTFRNDNYYIGYTVSITNNSLTISNISAGRNMGSYSPNVIGMKATITLQGSPMTVQQLNLIIDATTEPKFIEIQNLKGPENLPKNNFSAFKQNDKIYVMWDNNYSVIKDNQIINVWDDEDTHSPIVKLITGDKSEVLEADNIVSKTEDYLYNDETIDSQLRMDATTVKNGKIVKDYFSTSNIMVKNNHYGIPSKNYAGIFDDGGG